MEFAKEILLSIGMIMIGLLETFLSKDLTVFVMVFPVGIACLIATIKNHINEKHDRM